MSRVFKRECRECGATLDFHRKHRIAVNYPIFSEPALFYGLEDELKSPNYFTPFGTCYRFKPDYSEYGCSFFQSSVNAVGLWLYHIPARTGNSRFY